MCGSVKAGHEFVGINSKATHHQVHRLIANVNTNRVLSRPAPRISMDTTQLAGSGSILRTPDSGGDAKVVGLKFAIALGTGQ